MTIYDDMRGYVHTHDRNGWFDVAAETTPMYRMIDKAEAENAKLRELVTWMYRLMDESCAVQHPYAPEPIRYDTLLDVRERLRDLRIEEES